MAKWSNWIVQQQTRLEDRNKANGRNYVKELKKTKIKIDNEMRSVEKYRNNVSDEIQIGIPKQYIYIIGRRMAGVIFCARADILDPAPRKGWFVTEDALNMQHFHTLVTKCCDYFFLNVFAIRRN